MAITIPTAPRNTAPRTRAIDLAPAQQVSPDTFGAGLAQGVGRASQILEREILAPAWEQANGAMVDGADGAVLEKRAALNLQLSQAKGEHAIKLSGELEKALQTEIEKQRAGLTNDAQRSAFDGRARRAALAFESEVGNHVAREADAVAVQRNQALVQTQTALAVRNRADEGQSWTDQLNAETVRTNFLHARGVPKDAIKAELAAMRSSYVAQIVMAHADDKNDAAAEKWAETNAKDLLPEDERRVKSIVQQATTAGKAMRRVDEFMRTPGRTINDVLEHGQTIESATDRAAFERRALEIISLRERAAKEAEDNAFEQAYELAKNNPAGINAVPITTLTAMGPAHRQTLESWSQRQATGTRLPWDQSKAMRYKLEDALADPRQREQLMSEGPAAFLGTMNEDDQNAVASLMKQVREGGDDDGLLASNKDLFHDFVSSLKIATQPAFNSGGKSVPNEAYISLRNAVDIEQKANAAKNKRTKPNADDMRAAIATVAARKAFTSEGIPDPELPVAAMTPEQRAESYVPIKAIDAGRVQAIRSLITIGGGEITENRIEQIYAAFLAGDRERIGALAKEK